ncbi:phospho-2-dehydro-3-deoxyheptonate aldolase [Schizosaccharomyces cryophilus OY26]|uniref:Phospho-2-dehydro-3-deoxyheptonate aldolase n=1 Tax=Schizosaccharomyces cryophilus (strain OY26 / ATCC MYA-4695 / CBS 11777 / NBRC 106824 / NRRL Y48691) TaxID=653667 RepID=S9VZR5_SCHCR|nr:phospho-2-dehydro-3-deoxyheptonate aldolase [Schizosaccharomyces cryophilus OY26]EPY53183.1 phospho-2-dehydro-3-deoxyheptonate aldolase [Schizosaccharomyces cryophilus OY26]
MSPAFLPNGATNDSEALDDSRIMGYNPLVPPALLQQELPATEASRNVVKQSRRELQAILNKTDDRIIVVVGPCSIHDPQLAIDYAKLLKPKAEELKDALCIVMRCYLEKPRTTVGWKGLVNDPNLDGSYAINKGLHMSRKMYCDVTDFGVPVASEMLDSISPQFFGDLLSFGAIGARTTESQLHRELASALSFPVGFKNGTDGTINVAVDAIGATSHPHTMLGVNKQGIASICMSKGNKDTFIVLRGGKKGPNYDAETVRSVREQLIKSNLPPRIMVDCSHGNSCKNHRNQPLVSKTISEQVRNGDDSIIGLMIESHINEGRQDAPIKPGIKETLKYGVSITDACVSWEQTTPMLDELAEAVRIRRQNAKN